MLNRRTKRRAQRGEMLIEVLAAIVIIGVIIGALASLLATSSVATARSNQTSRLNVALTGMSEIVKSLDYVRCADASDYQLSFNDNEDAAALSSQQIDQRGSTVTFTVVSVDSCVSGVDQGTQDVALTVAAGGQSLNATVVKRDPQPRSLDMFVVLAGTPVSTAGDVRYGFQLSGEGSFSPRGVVRYDFSCAADPPSGDPNNPGIDAPTTIQTSDPNDPAARCMYQARSTAYDALVTLTITDSGGVTLSKTERWNVPAANAPHVAPTATFTWSPPTTTQQTKTFTSTSPTPPTASIVKWEWVFGDGTTTSCTDGTCATTPHTYASVGTYVAELRLTDSLGFVGVSSPQSITITAGSPSTTAGPTTTTTVVPPPLVYTGTADKFWGCFSGPAGDDAYTIDLGTDGWWDFYLQGCTTLATETVVLHDPPGAPVGDAFRAPSGRQCAMNIERTNGSVLASTPYYTDRVAPVADTGGWIFIQSDPPLVSWPTAITWRITCIAI